MKPHIFKDNGWKVGMDDRAHLTRNIRHASEVARDLTEGRTVRGYIIPWGGPKITGESARNTAPFALSPPIREDLAP